MTHKRWRYDGPPHSSKGYEHSWAAFQGCAYPNPYNGSLNYDQMLLDRERDRWIEKRDSLDAEEKRRVEKRLRKRRREKTGRR
jgi:hypothetical protein